MKTLKEKIAKAIAPRMETIKYGSNKGELEEQTNGYIRVTPEEFNFLVRMRMVRDIRVPIDSKFYLGNTDRYYSNYRSVSITKKTAKKMASDLARDAKNYGSSAWDEEDEPITIRVFVYKVNDINFNTKLMITLS